MKRRYDRGDMSFVIVSGIMVFFMVPGLGRLFVLPKTSS